MNTLTTIKQILFSTDKFMQGQLDKIYCQVILNTIKYQYDKFKIKTGFFYIVTRAHGVTMTINCSINTLSYLI